MARVIRCEDCATFIDARDGRRCVACNERALLAAGCPDCDGRRVHDAVDFPEVFGDPAGVPCSTCAEVMA